MSDINTMRDAYEHWTAVGASDEKQAEARRKFDAILAAHDAAKRAEWEAEQGETEWEYGHDCDESRATHHKNPSPQNPWQSMGTCTSATDYRRRKAGPWITVPDTTKNESEWKA